MGQLRARHMSTGAEDVKQRNPRRLDAFEEEFQDWTWTHSCLHLCQVPKRVEKDKL